MNGQEVSMNIGYESETIEFKKSTSELKESFGSGFERTFRACNEAGVEYSYHNAKSGFEFVFKRPLGHNNVQEMSKTELAVYEEIKKNGFATAKQIAAQINKSEKTVYRAIKKLKELGKIKRQGDDYNGSWITM